MKISKCRGELTDIQEGRNNLDRSRVAKVSEFKRNPSYLDTFQSTSKVLSPEKCPRYSGIRVTSVRVIGAYLYCLQQKHWSLVECICSFLAKLLVWLPRKVFVLLSKIIFYGSKYLENI